jgi:hypothetical protein
MYAQLVKMLATLLVLVSGMGLSFSQASRDSIQYKKINGDLRFYQDGNRLWWYDVVDTLEPNPQAHQLMKSARSTRAVAGLIGGAGGFMAGWAIGGAIGGGEFDLATLGIGAGLIVVALPLSAASNKKAISAVSIYNRGLQSSSFWERSELRFSVNGNGAGFTLRF